MHSQAMRRPRVTKALSAKAPPRGSEGPEFTSRRRLRDVAKVAKGKMMIQCESR